MSKFNKEIKKNMLYLLAVLLAFIGSLVGLDQLNHFLDKDINKYVKAYEVNKKLYEEKQLQTSPSNN